MKIRIQLGLQVGDSVTRKVRLTPVDQTLDVSDEVGQALLLVAGVADLADMQPGDGEVDIKLGQVNSWTGGPSTPPMIRQVLQFADSAGISGDASVFVRVRRAE